MSNRSRWGMLAFFSGLLAAGVWLTHALPPQPVSTPDPPRLYHIQLNGKVCYMDRTGRVVVQTPFDSAGDMREGYAVVTVDRKSGRIDRTADVGAPGEFHADLKLGLIDRTGKLVVWPRYSFFAGLDEVREGLALFREGGKYGYLDPRGTAGIPARFDLAHGFSEGVAAVALGEKWGFIALTGAFVIPPTFDRAYPFREGLACVRVGREWGYIGHTGRFAFDRKYDYAFDFSDGMAAVNRGGHEPIDTRDEIGGKWGFIDRHGCEVIPPHYGAVKSFSDGLAAVNLSDWYAEGWGFIDKTGAITIDLRHRWVEPFSDGLAVVTEDFAAYGYMDRKGKHVIPPRFHHAGPFVDGLARVGVGEANENLAFGYIDRTGRYVHEPSR